MNINHNKLKRAILSTMLIVIVFTFGSCTKESIAFSMPDGGGMAVRVTFPQTGVTRAATGGSETGTADENRLDRVTIFVFNGAGMVLENVLSVDVTSANTSLPASQPKWATDQTLLISPVVDPSSPKKIYAVANWNKTTFDKATYTEAMLKEEMTIINSVADVNGAVAYPMLMSGSKAVVNLTSLFYHVTVDMERQVSKIRTLFTIPIDVQNYHPHIEWQTGLMKMMVVNVPNKSYLVGRGVVPEREPGYKLLNSALIAVDDTKPLAGDQTIPAQKDLKWSESVYVYENPVAGIEQANKDVSTYIVVQLPYKNRITGNVDFDNYYKLNINDTRDATSPHKVLRNTIYNFNIRILGMGLPINNLIPDVNVDDELTVNSWEKGEIGDVEVPQHYFNIDRTYLAVSPLESNVRATLSTDVADWKLIKADGTTIFSFVESKTAEVTIDGITYVLSGKASAATITVSNNSSINFPIQRMFFIARNLKIPFTVVSDYGFIPNSVLIAAGWPLVKLPLSGLQLAKRGPRVSPDGVAVVEDPSVCWKEELTFSPGTVADLGMGMSSTAAMAGAEHPAAQYCRDMGNGWFLPSKNELSLIYNNRSTFGPSYRFNDNYYWSSTEYNEYNSWHVNFAVEGSGFNGKANLYIFVRCVKAV